MLLSSFSTNSAHRMGFLSQIFSSWDHERPIRLAIVNFSNQLSAATPLISLYWSPVAGHWKAPCRKWTFVNACHSHMQTSRVWRKKKKVLQRIMQITCKASYEKKNKNSLSRWEELMPLVWLSNRTGWAFHLCLTRFSRGQKCFFKALLPIGLLLRIKSWLVCLRVETQSFQTRASETHWVSQRPLW